MYFKVSHIFKTQGRSNYRIPSLAITEKGTVLAFCNDRLDTLIDHADESLLVCCSKKLGEDWSEVRTLVGHEGWACSIGSAVYDRMTDTVFCWFHRIGVNQNEYGRYSEEDMKLREQKLREKEARTVSKRAGIC